MFPKKINTPSAVRDRNNFPLDHKHVTTSDFGLTQITEFMNLAPTDVVDLNLKTFAQLDPLLVPSFGGARLIHRAFFVPYDFISADWKSFISNHSLNDDSISSTPQVPVLNFESLCSLFFGFSHSNSVSFSEVNFNDSDYGRWLTKKSPLSLTGTITEFLDFFDFYPIKVGSSYSEPDYFDYSSVITFSELPDDQYLFYYRFTPLGKNCWNLFTQLGYNIGLPSPTAFVKFLDNTSALPLFAITKIFIDNFVDARYNWSTFTSIFKQFTTEGWAAYDSLDQARVIHDMLVLCCFAWFDNDLFTSAWQSHSNPSLSGMFKSLNINDEDVQPNVHASAPANSQSDPTVRIDTEYLSQHMLDILKSVTSYFTRNNIAGSRPIDILLARFNVKQPEVLAQMSQYLGSFSCDVNISQVVATSSGVDAEGQSNFLGDKGGQGTITSDNQSFHIHFENKYFYGYLIVVSHIMPITSYFQGLKPHVLQTKLFDFYTPEFDELGSEALPNKVLFSELGRETKMSSDSFDYMGDAIFGFVPRYYGYKFGFDTLSGDFRIPQFATELRAFEMFRHLTGIEGDFDPSKLINNQQFRIFSDDKRKNYDEMFVYQDIIKDHFVINTVIECNANRPMAGVGKSLIGKIEGGRNMVSLNPTGKKF